MDWTQLLKELADAVEVRNRRVAALRSAGSHVAELAAQALVAGAPGPPLRRILAGMEPLVEHERPHVCGHSPAVPPARPEPPPVIRQPLPVDNTLGQPVRYSLDEAWQQGILPWKATTARTYMRRRSPERGIPVPEGEPDGQTVRYTEDELKAWRAAWEKQAIPAPNGRVPQGPQSPSH
ncbi:hypothetical protein [Streptomyces clavuligerus]|nr:hypothetical protein [Streptomyces clavuligerus]AXU16790.1 hypothetical protein D1794_28895 [Streptomyces clavuligerus]MBY6300921.1 hypothetical protein [Streptomyces clavuligerus]QPJ97063.1 hypothetical protein GE265_28560 [Streptomyces clavuligerus]WDN55731.1 hypothetical protein LL058_27925 [Streptomyces clavuligerus]